MDDGMKAWQEYMTPGKWHEVLHGSVGKWKTVTKYWYAPGAEPEASEGSAEAEMIMGGRYLQTVINGEVMGVPLDGRIILGYDNARKEYESVWYDSVGTGLTFARGNYDAEKNSLIMNGEFMDAVEHKPKKYKAVTTYLSANEVLYEMYFDSPEGVNYKAMEVVYQRVK